jgi:hypothetical protein
VNDGGTARPTIQEALNSAEANGPGRDRIELGPRKFANGPFAADATNPVRLIGSGSRETALARTNTDQSQAILSLADGDSRISKLKVRLNDGIGLTGIETPGGVELVRVIGDSEDAAQHGVELGPGGSLRRSRVSIRPTGFDNAVALQMQGPGTVASRVKLSGNDGVSAFNGTGADPVVGRRLRIVADGAGFRVGGGMGSLDQATIRSLDNGSALGASSTSVDASLVARHVTAVGEGDPNSIGALASAISKGLCGDAELKLRNVILRGFELDLHRNAGCSGGEPPSASIDVAWSVFDPMKLFEQGDGEIVEGSGNRDTNPRFVDRSAGDYHLRRSSPLIDEGQPGGPGPGQSKVDLDGRRRVIDGDSDGKRRRDIGAFERPKP